MQKPFIIGVSGGSGSGKTSVIRHLRKSFPTDQLCLVSQDDYYKKREDQLVDENGVQNFDLPTSILSEEFANDVRQLIAGNAIEIDEYVFNNTEAQSKKLSLFPAPIIVVEGLFVFHFEALAELMDLKIFVDASDVVKVKRRIVRDQIERNYPLDDVLYRYEKHVLPSYEQFIEPYRKSSDIVINNEYNYIKGIEVLEGFIRQKLLVKPS